MIMGEVSGAGSMDSGQVADLEREWRRVASRIGESNATWDGIRELCGRAGELGARLLEAPATELGEVATKVRWLAEQDLDSESLKGALVCVLSDLDRLTKVAEHRD
jgi:hypothetical protein